MVDDHSPPRITQKDDKIVFLVPGRYREVAVRDIASLEQLSEGDSFQISVNNGESFTGTYDGSGSLEGKVDSTTFVYGRIADFKKIVIDPRLRVLRK